MLEYTLHNEKLKLLGEKALFWPAQNCLLLADTHFGKVMHFRKAGMRIPRQAAKTNLLRFSQLVKDLQPKRVLILGDLFHSDLNTEWLDFKSCVRQFPNISFELVAGNHDILHPQSYAQLNFQVHQKPLELGPFLLSHEPLQLKPEAGYNLCGHIHPGVRMQGSGRQSLRLPCFYFGAWQGILPAFGEFTGLYQLKPQKQDAVFIISEQEVIRVN